VIVPLLAINSAKVHILSAPQPTTVVTAEALLTKSNAQIATAPKKVASFLNLTFIVRFSSSMRMRAIDAP
jgi:hypothetical protein